jgi:pSer/pThr/pTyr-binding forkhead associated (FHA) protein
METLALIELLDRDGLARQTVRVTHWPVRIGRAIDCDVVLDDPHVAPHHADLDERDGAVRVVPAPSVNGVRVGRTIVAHGAASPLAPAGELTIGLTTLRVRLAGAALAPEQPLPDVHLHGRRQALSLFVLAVVAALWAGFEQWVSTAPGESTTEMTGLYLAAPIGLGIWCGLWAMGSKLFQRQFAFWPHLHAALAWPLLAMVAETVSGQLAFALSMPVLAKIGHVVAGAALAMLLWRHLGIVLPQRRRAIAWAITGLVIAGGGLDVAERAHHQQPLVGSLWLGTISVPWLRVAPAESTEAFVQSAQPLEQTLQRWAKSTPDADTPGGDDDDEGDGDD